MYACTKYNLFVSSQSQIKSHPALYLHPPILPPVNKLHTLPAQ